MSCVDIRCRMQCERGLRLETAANRIPRCVAGGQSSTAAAYSDCERATDCDRLAGTGSSSQRESRSSTSDWSLTITKRSFAHGMCTACDSQLSVNTDHTSIEWLGKEYRIGTLHYNWPMSAHASQVGLWVRKFPKISLGKFPEISGNLF